VVWFRERSDAEYTSSVQSRRFVNNVDHITENGGDYFGGYSSRLLLKNKCLISKLQQSFSCSIFLFKCTIISFAFVFLNFLMDYISGG